MRIIVKVRPSAGKRSVEKLPSGDFLVCVIEPPVKGRANKAVIQAVAEYFKIAKSSVEIISGETNRKKTLEIDL